MATPKTQSLKQLVAASKKEVAKPAKKAKAPAALPVKTEALVEKAKKETPTLAQTLGKGLAGTAIGAGAGNAPLISMEASGNNKMISQSAPLGGLLAPVGPVINPPAPGQEEQRFGRFDGEWGGTKSKPTGKPIKEVVADAHAEQLEEEDPFGEVLVQEIEQEDAGGVIIDDTEEELPEPAEGEQEVDLSQVPIEILSELDSLRAVRDQNEDEIKRLRLQVQNVRQVQGTGEPEWGAWEGRNMMIL